MGLLQFLGASGEVTGSNFLIKSNSGRYLVDLGLFQGSELLTKDNYLPLSFNPAEINAVIITHAHLDHIGRLPLLAQDSFKGKIYATPATCDLAKLVLEDALSLMEERYQREGEKPLYDRSDLNRIFSLFEKIDYQQKTDLIGGDYFLLYDAGHILGSASVLLVAGGKRLVFSGDLGNNEDPLLDKPTVPSKADIVVMEGTYGARNRANLPTRQQVLLDAINWVYRNKGVLLIPAFAIERSQEILFILNDLYNKQNLPRMPFFLDSPLAIEALEVFERHIDLLSQKARRETKKDENVFQFRSLVLCSTVAMSRGINNQPPPKVIIAGSGMMEGGRVIHHLARYLDKANTYLLIIGYQAKGTLGDFLQHGAKEVVIHNRLIPIKARIETYDIFSSHADHDELIEWAKKTQVSQQIFIVHADTGQAACLQKSLEETLGKKVVVSQATRFQHFQF